MENKFFEMISSSELDLNQLVKKGIMFKAASAKIANPKETKKNIAKSLNVSERTLQRYASDLNFTTFKKHKPTSHFTPIKCLYCSFIAKNKSGLGAHTRSRHLEELASTTQNQPTVTDFGSKKETKKKRDPLKNKEVKESIGLGKVDEEEKEPEKPFNVLDFISKE